jgi:hypothetical protein
MNDNDKAGHATTSDSRKVLRFVALENRVHYGSELICRCKSANMAKRVAAALNEHQTDRRGQ